VTDDDLIVELVEGRTITVPVAWFPRLAHGTRAERAEAPRAQLSARLTPHQIQKTRLIPGYPSNAASKLMMRSAP
jgi:hypothetical protein